MTGTPILSSRIALGLAYVEARLIHERVSLDILSSVTGDLRHGREDIYLGGDRDSCRDGTPRILVDDCRNNRGARSHILAGESDRQSVGKLTDAADAQSPLSRDQNKTGRSARTVGATSESDRPLRSPGDGEGSVVFVGQVPCVLPTRSALASKSKSNAASCRALHDCAVQDSAAPVGASGLTKPPRNWPPEWDAPFEQPLMKSPENVSRLHDLLASLWPRSPNGLCGKD
jgi:hypothetical protein